MSNSKLAPVVSNLRKLFQIYDVFLEFNFSPIFHLNFLINIIFKRGLQEHLEQQIIRMGSGVKYFSKSYSKRPVSSGSFSINQNLPVLKIIIFSGFVCPQQYLDMPRSSYVPTILALKPQKLVTSKAMEKNLVCSKRENWRVCWLRISRELLLCLLKNYIVRLEIRRASA